MKEEDKAEITNNSDIISNQHSDSNYEILSFSVGNHKQLYEKRKNGLYSISILRRCFNKNTLLNLPNHKIHSVKQLSTGIVFTIGDNLRNGTIIEITISENNNIVFKTDDHNYYNSVMMQNALKN